MIGMPMWVVRRIRIDCPIYITGVEAPEVTEHVDTDHGQSSEDTLLKPSSRFPFGFFWRFYFMLIAPIGLEGFFIT